MRVDDLVTWLRDQLDEDERFARHMENAVWPAEWPDDAARQFSAYWTPPRVLAEVDAKRRMVGRLAETLASSSEYFTVESCDEPDAILAERMLRLLALPYGDRPGFNPQWAIAAVA